MSKDDRREPGPQRERIPTGQVDATLAYQDALTHVHNRRFLTHLVEEEWEHLVEEVRVVTLILVDLDLFKDVNDTWGHQAGDEVLRVTAEILLKHFRKEDFVIRYGGDEFVVVAPGVGAVAAEQLADRAREALHSHRFPLDGAPSGEELPISFSLGVASCPEDGSDPEALFEVADKRLYEDKKARRPPKSQERGKRMRLVIGAVALLVGVLAGVLGISWWSRQTVPDPVAPPLAPFKAGPSTREAELAVQIRDLETRITELITARDESSPGEDQEELQAHIQELEGTIGSLRTELVEVASDPVEVSSDPVAEVADVEPPPVEELPSASPEVASSDPQPKDEPILPPPVTVPPTRPVLVSMPDPEYPRAARRLRREATIHLKLVVNDQGKVTGAEATGTDPGYGFVAAAEVAVRKAVFRPGTRKGVGIEMETTLDVQFRLGR